MAKSNEASSGSLARGALVWALILAITIIADLWLRKPDRLPVLYTSIGLGALLIYAGLYRPARTWPLLAAGVAILFVGPYLYKNYRLGSPEYYAAQERQSTACKSNLKQLALAMIMYAGDWDETLPPAETWVDSLQPYVKNERLFKCAQDDSGARSSYAMNEMLDAVHMNELEDPQNTVLLFETDRPGDNPAGRGRDVPETGRHEEGINIAYVDGHVGWIELPRERRRLRWWP